ncbi:MAG: acetamidase/formamidase family protein, partial [Gammaproteobacteria bacterium]
MPINTDVYIAINRNKTLSEEPTKGHNRWHPDIPSVVKVDPGQVVGLETRDAFDGQVKPTSTAADLLKNTLGVVHPLTGPVYVNGAEPGDLLEVTIVEVEPQPFGFTVQVPGFGFLRDIFTEPYIVPWTIANGFATSPALPGVRIPGAPFMGVIGLAPSHELLTQINKRETDLAGRGGVVLLPDANGAVPSDPAIAKTAMRTIAPHETGGNLDVKQLTKGTTLRMPVYVPGA